jgi:predicted site-specific integrase-resolvase
MAQMVTAAALQARISSVDALEADDRQVAQQHSPAQKLAQALELMSSGIRLKRANLERQFPRAGEAEIERLLTAWLTQDG